MNYQQLKDIYSVRNSYCSKIGRVYDMRENELNDVFCMKWHCIKCRKILKFIYFLEILKNVYSFKMDKHFVITIGGREIRKNIDWFDSYSYMSKKWNNFRALLYREFGQFDYILLTRSHKDGYCHYHIIVNKYMSWKRLNDFRKKYKLGFVSIQKNKSVAEYLITDFFKDYEFIIPFNRKHIRSSKSILLRNFEDIPFNKSFFPNNVSLKDIEFYIKTQYNPDFDIYYYKSDKQIKENLIF